MLKGGKVQQKKEAGQGIVPNKNTPVPSLNEISQSANTGIGYCKLTGAM
jgi:hypothetical protein